MKFVDKIFSSSGFFRDWIFFGKWAAFLQIVTASAFFLWSRLGGPLGSMARAEILLEAGAVTLVLTLASEIALGFYRRAEMQNNPKS